MKHNWEYSICIGTVFFVASQVFLKKSFDNSDDYIRTLLYFTLAITIMTIIGFIFYSDTVITKLGIIRTFMAGFETIILFGVGYLIFNEKINRTQSIGVLSILLGIYLIGNR